MDNRSIFSLSLQKEADGNQFIQRRCLPGQGWPNDREISGRIAVKQVAESA
jgi:hypothetical protein